MPFKWGATHQACMQPEGGGLSKMGTAEYKGREC